MLGNKASFRSLFQDYPLERCDRIFEDHRDSSSLNILTGRDRDADAVVAFLPRC